MKEKSEFGKGLVICLVKFVAHEMWRNNLFIYDKWLKETPENRKKMLSENVPGNLNYGSSPMRALKQFVEMADEVHNGDYEKNLSREIEMSMNGASDHLYDIEVPKGKSWDKIRKLVNRLKNKGLEMGHGFNPNKKWTIKDFNSIFNLARKISLEIDAKLGLKAEMGEW